MTQTSPLNRFAFLSLDSDDEEEQQPQSLEVALIPTTSTAIVLASDLPTSSDNTSSSSFSLISTTRRRCHGTVKVLIDGDGDILAPHSIRRGKAGGREIAETLHAYVSSYCLNQRIEMPIPRHYLVNVYVNKEGLGNHLEMNGLATKAELEDFVRGFNSSRPMFYITDTGNEEQGADQAIINELHYWTSSNDCSLLLLGGLHDKGYRQHLLELPPISRAKVTLVQTNNRAHESYENLGLQRVNLQPMFLDVSFPRFYYLTPRELTRLFHSNNGTQRMEAAGTITWATVEKLHNVHTATTSLQLPPTSKNSQGNEISYHHERRERLR
ncbi:hypothetical protein P7C70_g2208, partial [Phenoliferia sp. Uapishka_3]